MRIMKTYGSTKLVYYFGVSLEVPDWTRYIAADDHSNLWCFDEENKPWTTKDGFWGSDGNAQIIAKVDLEGADWMLSLMTY